MFNKKQNLVIAITTYDIDALRISVPPVRRCARDATLVIYNDNPNIELSRQFVRKLGWRGTLYIKNTEKNLGEFESRIAVLEYIVDEKIPCDWVLFVDDDDALIDATVPHVSESTFAIIQNATTISEKLTDIFKITPKWIGDSACGKTGPHFDITGTFVRYDVAAGFAKFMRAILPETVDLARALKYRAPVGAILWTALNTLMRVTHPEMSAIYMNQTNYVSIKLGHATKKYGMRVAPGNCARAFNATVIKKYAKMFETVAMQNMVADNQ